MADSNIARDGRLPAVQALRAIAALAVVLFHSNEDIFVGTFGVDLFFVISGFIMVYTSQDKFGLEGVTKPFLVRRFLRIYPPYWIATLLVLTVIKWPTYHRYFTSFLLIPTEKQPILPPGWSLFYEIGFYLLFGLCLRLKMLNAIICVCLVLISLVVLRQALIDFFPITWGRAISLEFGMGCIVGYVYCKGMRLGRKLSLSLVVTGLLIISLPVVYRSLSADFPFRPMFWGVGAILIFMGTVFGPRIKFFENRFIQLLGDASYSIYVAHFIIVLGLLQNPYKGVSTFILSIIFGLGFYMVIEQPLTAALKKRVLPRFPFPKFDVQPIAVEQETASGGDSYRPSEGTFRV